MQEFVESADKLSIQCRMLSERVAAHFHRHKTGTELMRTEVHPRPPFSAVRPVGGGCTGCARVSGEVSGHRTAGGDGGGATGVLLSRCRLMAACAAFETTGG